jgi:60 kDa SS-A/Ro ribonucleoprotein
MTSTTDPLRGVSTRRSPQSQPDTDPAVAARQVANAAGGYVFAVGDETKIHRFLTLGVEGGTFYATEREITQANAATVLSVARARGEWLVSQIVEISTAGRAPRNGPALFALAAVAGLGDEAARKAALAALPAVARTGTHLFTFVTYVAQFRGWGGGLRRAVGRWYLDKDVDDLAYQLVKYRQRAGWSHRDVLRQAHPDFHRPSDPARSALFDWVVDGVLADDAPDLVHAFATAQRADLPADGLADLIANYPLSWEMLPDAARTPDTWKALIRKGMPQTALMRQLPTLTRAGVFENRELRKIVCDQLADAERLRRGRVHPVNVLVAAKTYAAGRSPRGSGTWTPDRHVVDALDEAFYAAFRAVEPTGKRTLVALDVSGSMTWETIGGTLITPREASGALALVTLATESDSDVVAFTGGRYLGRHYGTPEPISELAISPRQRLDDVLSTLAGLHAGPTDCAAPFLWASERGRDYDTVIIYTDNESWSGEVHVHQALAEYRRKVGHDVRLAIVALTATEYSVADPADPHSIDIAGFDAAVPNLLADFSAGRV